VLRKGIEFRENSLEDIVRVDGDIGRIDSGEEVNSSVERRWRWSFFFRY
jgi:hypothetical protein